MLLEHGNNLLIQIPPLVFKHHALTIDSDLPQVRSHDDLDHPEAEDAAAAAEAHPGDAADDAGADPHHDAAPLHLYHRKGHFSAKGRCRGEEGSSG